MDLGGTIIQLRQKMGLKQKELAEMANISATYLSLIEQNKRDVSLTTLKEIASVLQIPAPFLCFLSITEDDIPHDKKEAYRIVEPFVKSLITPFIEKEIKNVD